MRPFELLLSILTFFTALTLFRTRPPQLAWLFCALTLSLLTLHILREGPHWQLASLYAALILVAIFLFRPNPHPWIAGAAITLTAASLALSWALPLFHLPAPTGPYAIGTRTLHLTDPTTHRELVTQLWYPSEAAGVFAPYLNPVEIKPLFRYLALIRTNAHQDAAIAGKELPVLLFNPSWAGRRAQDTFLLEDLASHGYLVAAIDHPGNAARVQLANGRVVRSTMAKALDEQPTPQAVIDLWNRELAVWTRDSRFVLDNLLANPTLAPHLDSTRAGAAGHSFGGATSLSLLGQDPRIRSAINMDGWTFAGLDYRTTQPILLLYSAPPATQDPEPETLPNGPAQSDQLERTDRLLVDANLHKYGGLKAYVQGSQHQDFTDQTLVSPIQRLTYTGPIPGQRMRQITREIVLGFFDQTLKHRGKLPTYPELRWTLR